MVSIAVIPARGGSKRIPGKNVMEFCGKPMIAWTIEASLDSGCFDRVLVSTDDEKTAEIAKAYGAQVPFLRNKAADDESHVSIATLAALDQAEKFWDERYETVTQLMPNCPLRTASDIVIATGVYAASNAPFQISCFKYGWMNPWWAVSLDDKGRSSAMFPSAIGKRSQDLDPLYCPSGAIWIARVSSLRSAGSFYGPGHVYAPMCWTSAVDIDDVEDLKMARAIRLLTDE